MARSATVDITILTDASKAQKGFGAAADAAERMGNKVDEAANKCDSGVGKIDKAAGAADGLDSKASQATGALGALSSGFELMGADEAAGALQEAALAADFLSGVGGILNLVMGITTSLFGVNTAATEVNTAATVAQTGATEAAAGAQKGLNLAFLASPIGLIILGVLALVAGFIVLYKKSSSFRKIVNKVFGAVKKGAQVAADVFKKVFSVAFDIVMGIIKGYWLYIKTVFRLLKLLWSGLKAILTKPFKAAKTVIENIADGLSGVFDSVFDALLGAVQLVIDAINALIRAFNKIPGHTDIPEIPDVASASAAVTSSRVASPGVPSATSGAASGGIQITVNGALDPEAVARQIRRILNGHDRRAGLTVT